VAVWRPRKAYVQKELRMALDILDEIPRTGIFILPVRLDECQPDHERLRRIHWGELFPCYETGLSQILRTISA